MANVLSAKIVGEDILEEVTQSARAAADHLEISPDLEPREIVRTIMERVDEARPLEGEDLDDVAVGYGCLWGEQVRRVLHWKWVELEQDQEFVGYGLAAPDQSLATLPMAYLREILSDEERDNTVLLLFNMLVAGNVPRSKPGQLRYLS